MFIYQLKIRNEIIPNYMMNINSEIYSLNSNKILRPFPNKENKLVVSLLINGVKKMIRLDYLVISTLGKYHDDIIRVIHLDDDDYNCNINNLMPIRKIDIINKYKEMYNVEKLEDICEEWKIHPDFPSIEISNFGEIRDVQTKSPIIPKERHGYLAVYVNKKEHFVHRLVAELYVENPHPDKFFYVNHLDGVKTNNNFYNLEWCNISMNTDHAYLTGLIKKYDDCTIHNVCKLLSQGISHMEISIITGVNRKFISDIYRGRRHKDISSQYEFKRRIPLSKLYNKDAMIALMQSGYKPKEIAALLKIEYNQSFKSYYERLRRENLSWIFPIGLYLHITFYYQMQYASHFGST